MDSSSIDHSVSDSSARPSLFESDFQAPLSKFHELFFQGFGLGARHFGRRGIACAGLKRSVGFMTQPVESWIRYPELSTACQLLGPLDKSDSVLDLGSPKMLGFLLAKVYPATFTLTDIWPEAVDEVQHFCKANAGVLQGHVQLQLADLTDMKNYADHSFSKIYSISVMEHIEDLKKTRQGVSEIARVAKPGATVVISVPVAPKLEAEYCSGSVYGRAASEQAFFAHYFDAATLRSVFESDSLELQSAVFSDWRRDSKFVQNWFKVPQKIRGLLGVGSLVMAKAMAKRQRIDGWPSSFPRQGDFIMQFRCKK